MHKTVFLFSNYNATYIRSVHNIKMDTKGVERKLKDVLQPSSINKGLKESCCLSLLLFKIQIQDNEDMR